MDVGSVLRRYVPFQRLSLSAFDLLMRCAELQRYERRGALWHEGDRACSFLIVGHGLVKVALPRVGVREPPIELVGPGESLGAEAVMDGGVCATVASALTETVIVAAIPWHRVRDALNDCGGAALALAQEMASRAAGASRRATLSALSVEERLANVLIDLSERFGDEMEDGSTLIPIRLTRSEISALVGATTEAVIRTLSRWARDSIVASPTGEPIRVPDPKVLVRIARGAR